MIVSVNKKDGYIKYRKLIDNNTCTLCKGHNVYNDKCYDCLKNDKYVYYYERNIEQKKHVMNMKFELSSKQKEASLFFLDHLRNGKNGYLNAVCGSGKTEIMYESILYALNNNLKILFSIPRREIVRELKNRLEEVFINTKIKVLDYENHDYDADLLISTVNQLINFEEEFDLIILDEADSYPYNTSDYLKRLLVKALKKDGVLFLMSATETNRITYDKYTISRRYHMTDLAMPKFYKSISPINDDRFNNILKNDKRKYIIYVSTIRKAKLLSEMLNTSYVSSKSFNSSKTINDLRSGKINVLVSTTLLERGITIDGLDVVIYDAENRVFTKEVIIQICGRVGRSFNDNKGNIYIFYKYNMLKFFGVKRYVRKMNEM